MCELITFIGTEAAKTVVALITTSIAGGIVWAITVRYRTKMLKALVSNPDRRFVFYFRGQDNTNKKRTITFNHDGTIGEGSNSDEHYWKASWGTLKIYSVGSIKFSEFKWDAKQGRLVHTNNPKLPSVMGQYMVPSLIPAKSQRGIYGP